MMRPNDEISFALRAPHESSAHQALGSSNSIAAFYALSDAIAVVGAAAISYLYHFGAQPVPFEYRIATLVGTIVTLMVFSSRGLFTATRAFGFVEHVRMIFGSWSFSVGSLLAIGFVTNSTERVAGNWALLWVVLSLALLIGLRLSVMSALRIAHKTGIDVKRVIVVGGGSWAAHVVEQLMRASWLGLEVVAIVDSDDASPDQRMGGISVQLGFDSLPSLIEKYSAHEVWICLPLDSRGPDGQSRIVELMDMLDNMLVNQRLFPEIGGMRLLNRPVTQVMGLPAVNLNFRPHEGASRLLKALEDRILALAILVIVSPLMLVIAAWIKIDSPGPVLFKQKRHGFDGKPFEIYKFRSMVVHEEQDCSVTQATKDDARVTRVGAFLRRTSLDELPQFFNVLRGNMSIVGPRPHAIPHNEYYRGRIRSYMQRHRVKPGITGWAQINGFRGETPNDELMRQRVNLDLYYIDNWSFWLDLRIIGRTIVKGFRGENAY